jgi:hypothetical protein
MIGTASCESGVKSEAQGDGATSAALSELTIYFSDEQGVLTDCAAVRPEPWAVPEAQPEDLPALAIRRVLRDVGPSEVLHRQGTLRLIEYFRGVRIENGTAIVAFDVEALEYLNSAACAQGAIKTPIVRTLIEFPNVDDVAWEIDGEIFTAWDA